MVVGAVSAITGSVYGLVLAGVQVIILLLGLVWLGREGTVLGLTGLATIVGSLIALPAVFGFVGFLQRTITAGPYNLVAGLRAGLRIETARTDHI